MLRTLLHKILLLFLASLISFALLRMAPGDFFTDASLDPQTSQESIERLRNESGIRKTFPAAYWQWLTQAIQGQLGESIAYRMPVTQLILPRALQTLLLSLISTCSAWLLAIALALLCARNPKSKLDRGLDALTKTLLYIPDLIFVYLAFALAAFLQVLTATGSILPFLLLTMTLFSPIFQHARAALLHAVDEPYIQAAIDLGLSGRNLWLKQVLPAAAHPLVALAGLSVSGLFSVSLLIEALTGWPGLGPLFLEAILARDTSLVLACLILSSAFVLSGNFFADLLLRRLDPRIGQP